MKGRVIRSEQRIQLFNGGSTVTVQFHWWAEQRVLGLDLTLYNREEIFFPGAPVKAG